MKVLVVIPNGPEEDYAPLVDADHEVVFGVSGSTRFVRMPDDELIALAEGAACLVFNVVSRAVTESLPRLTTVVSPYVGFDKIDVKAATEAGVLVCNPTALHVSAALPVLQAGVPVFIEKPVAASVEDAEALLPYLSLVVVGYCLRFHPMYAKIKQQLGDGLIGGLWKASFRRSFYLPLWHPSADYRTEYTARQELGGGVIRTLSHGIDLMHYLFGQAATVTGVTDRLSSLELDVDDFAHFSCRLESGARVNFEWDLFSPTNVDEGELVGDRGRLVFDLAQWTFHPLDGGDLRHATVPDGIKTMYHDQMADFLAFVKGQPTLNCGLADAIRVLEIIETVESGSELG